MKPLSIFPVNRLGKGDGSRVVHPLLILVFAIFGLGFWQTPQAQAGVTVHGYAQLWRPDLNQYTPLKRARVRIVLAEDYDYDTGDVEGQTDDNGYYVVKKGNAWWRSGYKAYAIVFAEVPGKLEIQDSWPQFDGYQATTGKVFAKDDKTTGLDVRLGGPQSNVSYQVGGLAVLDNSSATSATTGWRAFYLCDAATDHRLKLMNYGFSQWEEKEVVFPENSKATASYQSADLGGWDYIRVGSSNFDDAAGVPGLTRVSKSIRHEMSHGLMADTYYTWPGVFDIGSAGEHTLDKKAEKREFAWSEAWAEFAGQVTQREAFGATTVDFEGFNSDWHKKAVNNGDASFIEGEIIAALWDIYDGIGTEPCLEQNSDVPGTETFSDGIGNQIGKIRAIFEDNRPHSFTHESFFGSDSFIWYWVHDKKYGQHHELKTILYNRGIRVNEIQQSAPTLKIGATSWDKFDLKIPVTITENDAEDRPFVKVDLWAGETRLGSKILSTGWSGNTNTQTFAVSYGVQKGAANPIFRVAVSDEMQTVSAAKPIVPPASAYINGVGIEFLQIHIAPPQSSNVYHQVSDFRMQLRAIHPKKTGVIDVPDASFKSPVGSDGIQFIGSQPLSYGKPKEFFRTLQIDSPIQLIADIRANVWIDGKKMPYKATIPLRALQAANGYGIGTYTDTVGVRLEKGFMEELQDSFESLNPFSSNKKDAPTLYVGINYRIAPVTSEEPLLFVGALFPTTTLWTFFPIEEKKAPADAPVDAPQSAPKTPGGAMARANFVLEQIARLQAETLEISNEIAWKTSKSGIAGDGTKSSAAPTSIELQNLKAPANLALQNPISASILTKNRLLQITASPFLQKAAQGAELAPNLNPSARSGLQALDARTLAIQNRLTALSTQATTLRAQLQEALDKGATLALTPGNKAGGNTTKAPFGGGVMAPGGGLNGAKLGAPQAPPLAKINVSPRIKTMIDDLGAVAPALAQTRPVLLQQRAAIASVLKLSDTAPIRERIQSPILREQNPNGRPNENSPIAPRRDPVLRLPRERQPGR